MKITAASVGSTCYILACLLLGSTALAQTPPAFLKNDAALSRRGGLEQSGGLSQGLQPCDGFSAYQQPLDSANFSMARASDEESAFLVAEDFVDGAGVITPLIGPVAGLRWWGVSFDGIGSFCTADDAANTPFNITFWDDLGGAPGAVIASLPGTAAAIVDTGIAFSSTTIREYSASFAEVDVTGAAWVSIERVTGASICFFYWVDESLVGSYDDMAWQNGAALPADQAMCTAAPAAAPVEIPAVGTAGLLVLLVALLGIGIYRIRLDKLDRSKKMAFRVLFILATFGLSAPAAWGAEARLLTQVDIDGMGGPMFQGGVGDYLLTNNSIQAVVLAVGITPDGVTTTNSGLGSYFTNGLAPTGGILIDLMTTGDANDQLQTIVHNINLLTETGGSILYRGPEAGFSAPVLISGPTASITVTGVVHFPADGSISSVDNPTITAITTYSLTGLQSWIDITTTITNTNPGAVSIFTLGDENRYIRNQLAFQPFPGRGPYAPPATFANPTPSIGVMPWYPIPGLLDDSLAPIDAVLPVCYSFVSPSLATPFVGVELEFRRIVTTRKYDTTILPAAQPPLGSGASMTYDRRIVVAEGGSVEACAEVAVPLLYEPVNGGADLRAEFTGRVVTPTGVPIPDATIFFANVSPGFPVDVELNALSTIIELNFDGQANGALPAAAGSPVPATQVKTGADGTFSVMLQSVAVLPTATVYSGTIYAANRPTVALPPLTVDASTIATGVALGDIVLPGTGTLEVVVTEGVAGPASPAKISIFGTGVTENPDFGDQFISRTRFDGLEQFEGDGGAVVDRFNSARMSEAKRGYPAVNTDASPDGVFSLELAPGTYEVLASRGPEYSFDSEPVTITDGMTTSVSMSIDRVIETFGWSSVDSHVHAAPSNDAGIPLTDRVVSMLAAGVDTFISTEHDQMVDYQPVIQALGVEGLIRSVIGGEVSSEAPVPISTFTDGADAYPSSIGHIIGFPLSVIDGNRRRGAPTDEELIAATVFDRIRGMDSLPLLGATPDTATQSQWLTAIQAGQAGTPGAALPTDEEILIYAHPRGTGALGPFGNFDGTGYNPAVDIATPPNDLANLRSNYHADYVGADGTSTRGLDFDAFEILTSTNFDWYLEARDDWFSLLDQGIHKTAVAGSDTHRAVLDGAGYPRFYVPCDPCTEAQLVDHVRSLRVVGTTGPFIRLGILTPSISASTTSPVVMGSTVLDTFPIVFLIVDVWAAPWIPVEEIRFFLNGTLIGTISIAPGTGGIGGPAQRFIGLVGVLGVTTDAYFVVEAGNIISAPGGTPDNPGTLTDMRRLTTDDMVSLAFTNPIFVDRDGNGYQSPLLISPAVKKYRIISMRLPAKLSTMTF